jgi:hypothetical protein
LGYRNYLVEVAKQDKIMETAGNGRQNETFWEMSVGISGPEIDKTHKIMWAV